MNNSTFINLCINKGLSIAKVGGLWRVKIDGIYQIQTPQLIEKIRAMESKSEDLRSLSQEERDAKLLEMMNGGVK